MSQDHFSLKNSFFNERAKKNNFEPFSDFSFSQFLSFRFRFLLVAVSFSVRCDKMVKEHQHALTPKKKKEKEIMSVQRTRPRRGEKVANFLLDRVLGTVRWVDKAEQAIAIAKAAGKAVKGLPVVVERFSKDGALVFPGTRYIGPGNKLNEGKPVNRADRLAYVHDHQYSQLLEKGVNPYFTFNQADKHLLESSNPRKTYESILYWGMKAKKLLSSNDTPVSSVEHWSVKYGGEEKKEENEEEVRERQEKKKEKKIRKEIEREQYLSNFVDLLDQQILTPFLG